MMKLFCTKTKKFEMLTVNLFAVKKCHLNVPTGTFKCLLKIVAVIGKRTNVYSYETNVEILIVDSLNHQCTEMGIYR